MSVETRVSKVKNNIIEALRSTGRDGIEDLILYLENSSFFTDPASAKYHNAFPGGLADHCWKVYRLFSKSLQEYKVDFPEDSAIISSLLHDLCKVGTYKLETRNRKNEKGNWEKYPFYSYQTPEGVVPAPHGASSAFIAMKYIKLTNEEISAITNHMGMSDVGYHVQAAFKKFHSSLLLHIADMTASYMYETQEVQEEKIRKQCPELFI